MSEAQNPDIKYYNNFNEFFTRALKPEARIISYHEGEILSPVDGTVSQIGVIKKGTIFQAKKIHYPLDKLVADDQDIKNVFNNGKFATLYLSPKDYHRIHMPYDAKLSKMIHVPGRLYSVAPHTVNTVPNLFARNERVIAFFEAAIGKFALILVGAINVAAIETTWHGLVTPPKGKKISIFNYSNQNINLKKGDEMGRFNMGSTVIILTENNIRWLDQLTAMSKVQMGHTIGLVS